MPGETVLPIALASGHCVEIESELTLLGSVGQFGTNLPDDVRSIQSALNSLPPPRGGAQPKLRVDGASGPFTIAAIMRFQKLHGRQQDGRVDVGGPTLRLLNEELAQGVDVAAAAGGGGAGAGLPVLPNPNLVAAMIQLVPKVHMAIRAADAACVAADRHITSARLTRPGPDVSHIARQAIDNLQRTFRLTELPNPRPAFENIKRCYRNMTVALHRSFDTDPLVAPTLFVMNDDRQMDKEALAYTTAGGAFFDDKVRIKRINVPANRIYLCNGLATQDRLMQIRVLVHELAHYVSGQPIKIIDQVKEGTMLDSGQRKKFNAISAQRKVASAEHYAFFSILSAGENKFDDDPSATF